MPPTEKAAYTPGAERAAQEIRQRFSWTPHTLAQRMAHDAMASEIISRETHDAEMLEALRLALQALEDGREYQGEILEVIATVREAIAKVE